MDEDRYSQCPGDPSGHTDDAGRVAGGAVAGFAVAAASVASLGLALWAVQRVQFQVVNYTAALVPHAAPYRPSIAFAIAILCATVLLAVWAGRSSSKRRPAAPNVNAIGTVLWPLLFCVPVIAYGFVANPPFALSFLIILASGWTVFRAAVRLPEPSSPSSNRGHGLAVGSLLLLIVVAVVIHTRLQIRFFDHFMLGHADIGHFTEELKNALAGRGLRCDSFPNTRLGWHFVPLMYVLVPGYALWPSPIYLMVCGAVAVHVVALPVYYVARRLSGSANVGWMWAVAWLLLPSVGRLVYGNTYGFQWNNVTMPLLACVLAAGLTGRWRTSLATAALLLFCRETAASAVVGWGLYVALFTARRKTGVGLIVVAVIYFIICVEIIIPHFATAGRYERLDLFGELGHSVGDLMMAPFTRPDLFFGRLVRREGLYFLLILLVPMALLPLRGWRVAVAAVPTLMPLMLLKNADWMSVKFWHHATVLPFLFFAGMASMNERRRLDGVRRSARAETQHRTSSAGTRGWSGELLIRLSGCHSVTTPVVNRGMAAAVLVCAAWGHYLYGFSPISKSYGVLADASFWNEPDPRLQTVRRLRAAIPRDRTILATERLAAHFTDYKRLYTGRAIQPAQYIIIDRADAWDRSGLVQRVSQFTRDRHYSVYGEFGSIIVFERRKNPRPVETSSP